MTPDEAADLAARTFSSIDNNRWVGVSQERLAADRERVASDLAGLRDHGRWHITSSYECVPCARYETGLRRTANLYGVTL